MVGVIIEQLGHFNCRPVHGCKKQKLLAKQEKAALDMTAMIEQTNSKFDKLSINYFFLEKWSESRLEVVAVEVLAVGSMTWSASF